VRSDSEVLASTLYVALVPSVSQEGAGADASSGYLISMGFSIPLGRVGAATEIDAEARIAIMNTSRMHVFLAFISSPLIVVHIIILVAYNNP
jgi:hypothetical protein